MVRAKKTDRVNTVVFNLHQIKQLKVFFGTPGVVDTPASFPHIQEMPVVYTERRAASGCVLLSF